MPYAKMEDVPQALKTAGLTLSQANQWARYFDEAEDAGSKYPGAIAWVRFKYKHRKVGDKWVRKVKKSIEELFKVRPYLLGYSVSKDTFVPVLKNGSQFELKTIEKLFCEDMSRSQILAFDKEKQRFAWADIKGIYRLPYSGPMVTTIQKHGMVTTTPSHSLYDRGVNTFLPREKREVFAVRDFKVPEIQKIRIELEGCEARNGCISLKKLSNSKGNKSARSKLRVEYGIHDIRRYDLLRVLAWYITEGCTPVGTSLGYTVLFSNNDKSELEKIQKSLSNISNIHSRISGPDRYKTCTLFISCKLLHLALKEWCGQGSENKKFPDFIFQLPLKLKEFFLTELIKGDGSRKGNSKVLKDVKDEVYKQRQFWFTTQSFELATRISYLLSSISWNHNVRPMYRWRKYFKKPAYLVMYKTKNSSKGKKELEEFSVENEWVYDIECLGIHSFVCGMGGILCHNTLQDQIPKTIDKDVETIEQAKKYNKMNIYKINWRTGKVKMRMTRGGLRLANIMSQRKAPEPHEWLDFEGVIQPGHPGATRLHVGVMTKIDAGIVEHGMRKPYAHEWFKRGGKLTGKLVFRELPTASRPEVEKFETEDEIEKYCQEHEEEIIKEVEKLEFEELIKQADQPLPEAKPIPSIRRTFWIMMQPKDQTPYVLSSDAVKKSWMPPLGFSCMPKSDREKVPKELRFWEVKSKEQSKKMRDELVASKIFKATVKGKFVLQYQTWRGPIQIRFGPTTKRWHLWVDGTHLNHIELNLDPVKSDSLRAMVETTGDRSLIGRGVKGAEAIKPGTKFNPTKNTPSAIERLDTGSCLILEDSREFKKIEFFGKKLKGLWTLKREEPEMEIWVMERSTVPGEKFEKEFIPILKVDQKKHVVYGVVLEPEVWDAQQDIVSVDEIEKAAHDFLAFYRKIDLRHHYVTEKCYPVESYVAPQDMELGGEKVKKGSWILGTKVTDKKIWKDIEDGVLTGFSIVGYAHRALEE